MTDWIYWHVPGARSWHADPDVGAIEYRAEVVGTGTLCGRFLRVDGRKEVLDSATTGIPPDAYLCGNCARLIAARADVAA